MKKIYFLLILLMFTFSDKAFSQDMSSTAKSIIGTWVFNYETSVKNMEVSSKAYLDTVATIRKQRIESNYKGRIVNFNANGDYKQTLADGRISLGTWVLGKNEKHVVITDPNGNTYKQKIEVLSNKQLVLKPIVGGKMKMVISEWNFSKSKN